MAQVYNQNVAFKVAYVHKLQISFLATSERHLMQLQLRVNSFICLSQHLYASLYVSRYSLFQIECNRKNKEIDNINSCQTPNNLDHDSITLFIVR